MKKNKTQTCSGALSKRRSRKRADCVWTVVAFFVLQIGFATAIKTGAIKLDDSTTFATKAKRFKSKLEAVDDHPFVALAFGSSRIMNGFDAGSVAESLSGASGRRAVVYNFGVSGCGNIYSFLALEKLISQGVNPNLVLVELYPMFLVHGVEQKWFTANELRSKNFEDTERYGIEEVSRPLYQEWLIPWHTHRFSILNRVSPKLLPMKLRENWSQESDPFGWIAVDKPLEQTQLESQVETFADNVTRFRVGRDSSQAVRDTISLCQKHNIECAIVWMPESKEIRDRYPANMESHLTEFLDELRQEFDVSIVNARDWVHNRGFYDSCHLNRNGATAFTQRFSKQALPSLQRRAIARSPGSDSVLIR